MAVPARLPILVPGHHHARPTLGTELVATVKPATLDRIVFCNRITS